MSPKATLEGSLSFIGLADILQIMGGNNYTGTLRLATPYSPHPGFIYLRKGNPVKSVCGPVQGLEALYAMFGWVTGEFAFYEEEINVKDSIGRNRMEIVLDALRMLDDGLIQKAGPLSLISTEDYRSNSKGKSKTLIIKGPFWDYSYVVKEEFYGKGDTIVTEKRHGKWLWFINEGIVRVEKETPYGPITITRLGEGSFIGTVRALLFGEYARSATVTAENNVHLCLLDGERLHKEYASLSPVFRSLLLSLDSRLRKITDMAVLPHLGEDRPAALPRRTKTVIHKGSSMRDLYKIEEGEAYIVNQNEINSGPLLTLQKNEVFGFIPFLDIGHEPKSVSIVGSKELRLQSLDPEGLQKEYENLTSTFRNLIHHIGTCIYVTTDLLFQNTMVQNTTGVSNHRNNGRMKKSRAGWLTQMLRKI